MAKPYDKTTRRASAGVKLPTPTPESGIYWDDQYSSDGDLDLRKRIDEDDFLIAIIGPGGWSAWGVGHEYVPAGNGNEIGADGVAKAVEALTSAGVISAGDWE